MKVHSLIPTIRSCDNFLCLGHYSCPNKQTAWAQPTVVLSAGRRNTGRKSHNHACAARGGRLRRRWRPSPETRANRTCIMALRPQRTFRRRQVESSDSDSDGAEERPAEEPGEPGRPSAGGRGEGAEPQRRARGTRGRGRVWASSRRSPGTASRGDRGAGDRGAGKGLIRRAPAPEASVVFGLSECFCRLRLHVAVGVLWRPTSTSEPKSSKRSRTTDALTSS